MLSYCDQCEFSDYKGIYFCKKCFQSRTVSIENWEIDKISDKLYLGNEEGALNKDKLKELEITHILVCGVDLIKFHPEDFKYKQILIEDHPNEDIKKYFREALMFIESGKRVYVHCWAGVSRSASVVIAYIMWKKKLSYEEARIYVEEKRTCVNPNEGFISQLKDFDSFLNENSFKLKCKK